MSHASAGIVIDDFTQIGTPDPWPVFTTEQGTTNINEGLFNDANVIGGVRDTFITGDGFDAEGLDSIFVAIAPDVDNGLLDFASSVGAAGSLELVYGFGGNDLNADFSGEAGIEILFDAFDFANAFELGIMVELTSNGDSQFLTGQLTESGAQTATLLFDFEEGGVFDIADVDRISIEFDGGIGTDFRIDEIRTVVPSPAAWLVLTTGVIARKRRRRND
ncbi:MAG: hypothetical protein AAF432_10285 [Planctomycetota bacterium]